MSMRVSDKSNRVRTVAAVQCCAPVDHRGERDELVRRHSARKARKAVMMMTIGCETKEAQRLARLCKVIERVACSVLEEMSADDVLRHCEILGVMPGSTRARMNIEVGLQLSDDGPGVLQVLQGLDGLKGRLRAEVARSINRKRAPILVFDVVPLGGDANNELEP